MDSTTDQIPEIMTADLRREVRRKKILESAKTRLEKLNGRAPTHDSKSPEVLEYSDPEVEPNIHVESKVYQDESFTPFFAASNNNSAIQETPNIFVRSRAYIFIAAVVGFILSQYTINSLFVPVGLCMLIELFYFKGQNNPNNNIVNVIVPMALLLTGVSLGNKMKQISSLLSISQSLLINLAVTIFCICLSSFLFQYINLNYIVDIK